VNEAQGAQRLYECQLAPVELAKLLVAIDQRAQLALALRAIPRLRARSL
jgi:hypothetical protein